MSNNPIKLNEHTFLKMKGDGSLWLAKFENHTGLQAMTLTKEELTDLLSYYERN